VSLAGVVWPHEALAVDLRRQAEAAAPGRLAELVTIRVAQLLGAARLLVPYTETLCTAVAGWPTSDHITPAERTVLAVTEQFVIDVHGLGDTTFAAMLDHYAPDEVAAVMVHLAVTDGFTKRELVLPGPEAH
jgi:alkylhydroperoxidase family enzyme